MRRRVVLDTHVGRVQLVPVRDRYCLVAVEDNPRRGVLASFGKVEDALRWAASRRRADGALVFEGTEIDPEEHITGDTTTLP